MMVCVPVITASLLGRSLNLERPNLHSVSRSTTCSSEDTNRRGLAASRLQSRCAARTLLQTCPGVPRTESGTMWSTVPRLSGNGTPRPGLPERCSPNAISQRHRYPSRRSHADLMHASRLRTSGRMSPASCTAIRTGVGMALPPPSPGGEVIALERSAQRIFLLREERVKSGACLPWWAPEGGPHSVEQSCDFQSDQNVIVLARKPEAL
jgi:hypothetical protein